MLSVKVSVLTFTNDEDLFILYKLYKNFALHKPAKHPASSLKQEVDCSYEQIHHCHLSILFALKEL